MRYLETLTKITILSIFCSQINSKVIKIKGLLITSDGKPMALQFKDEIHADTIDDKELKDDIEADILNKEVDGNAKTVRTTGEENKAMNLKPSKTQLPLDLVKTIEKLLRHKEMVKRKKANESLPQVYVPVSEDNPNPQFIPQDFAKKKMFRDGLQLIDIQGSLVNQT